MSKVQVDTIDTRSGTSTMQIGSTNTSTINIGVSGDTVNIPSGVTIANAGTATGFGGANTPAFHVYLSGDQSINNNTATKVTFDSEYYDTDSAFASNKFTVPSGKAGTYNFDAIIKTQSVGDGTALQVFMYKNGSEIDGQQSRHKDYMSTGSSEELHCSFSYTDVASAGDYYELYVYQNNGNTRTIKAETSSFWGYKLVT